MAEGSAVLSSVSMFSGRRRLAGCEQPIQMAEFLSATRSREAAINGRWRKPSRVSHTIHPSSC